MKVTVPCGWRAAARGRAYATGGAVAVLCATAGSALAQAPAAGPPTNAADRLALEAHNVAQVMRLYEEAYHNDDYAVADEIFAPDYVRHDASAPTEGPGEAVLQSERTREVKRLVPDARYVAYQVVAADSDLVAVRWQVRGTPAGMPALMRRLVGKSGPIELSGANMFRFRDGRVVEVWNNRDDLTMAREMGLFRMYAAGGFLAGLLVAGVLALAFPRRRGAAVQGALGEGRPPARPARMRHRAITLGMLPALSVSSAATPVVAQRAAPIIDMHLHAFAADANGPPPISLCLPILEYLPTLAGAVEDLFRPGEKPPCPDPITSPMTDDEVMAGTIAVLERRNIIGVLSGSPERLQRWTEAAPGRFIPSLALSIGWEQRVSPDSLRRLVEAGRVALLGEVSNQYAGIAPDDERMAPYWALAEELGIPVAYHMGEGPPWAGYIIRGYRASLSSPYLLEDVLKRHPRLRISVMHYASPLIDEMIAMLGAYPQLYVDIGGIQWFYPRPYFHDQLRRLVDAGFGKRIMFGSDQMNWPGIIEPSIAIIEEAPFLSAEQKRDILYHNAARFLRLGEDQVARHHGR